MKPSKRESKDSRSQNVTSDSSALTHEAFARHLADALREVSDHLDALMRSLRHNNDTEAALICVKSAEAIANARHRVLADMHERVSHWAKAFAIEARHERGDCPVCEDEAELHSRRQT